MISQTTVSGISTEALSSKQTAEGIVVNGSDLNNLKITQSVVSEDGSVKEIDSATISSDKGSVLIQNNGSDVVIKEDTDGDGKYDKDISNPANTEETKETEKPVQTVKKSNQD